MVETRHDNSLTRMLNMRRQRGITFWGALFVIVLVVILALLFMRLFPPYFDNIKIQEGLKKLAENPDTPRLTRMQIINRLDNILYIDFAHEVVDLAKAIRIAKTKTNMNISCEYEVVVPLIYNLSALIEFKNDVDVPL